MYIGALFLSFIVFGVINWLYASGGLASAFHPFTYYSLFHGIVFVLRPAIAYFAGYDAIYQSAGFVPSLSDKLTVIGAANLGFIIFYIVCTRVGNEPMQFREVAAQLIERKLLHKVLPLFVLICAPIALYSFYLGVTGSAQGVESMAMRNGIRINTTSNGYLSEAARMLVPICAIFAWLFRFRLIALVPLALFFLLKASTGGRGSASPTSSPAPASSASGSAGRAALATWPISSTTMVAVSRSSCGAIGCMCRPDPSTPSMPA